MLRKRGQKINDGDVIELQVLDAAIIAHAKMRRKELTRPVKAFVTFAT